MFRTKNDTHMRLNNLLNLQILPALERCQHCGRQEADHGREIHDFVRDAARPVWHGWHAFRRGLATNLHDLGVDDMTIQRILRHSHVSVTQRCYIKTLPSAIAQCDEQVRTNWWSELSGGAGTCREMKKRQKLFVNQFNDISDFSRLLQHR